MSEMVWKYYKHALLPDVAPHEKIEIASVKKIFWKKYDGFPLFARWISDFDCNQSTSWWYCIKDTPFDINELKAKRRYEINKGKKNFEVKRINPAEFKEELYSIQIKALEAYPKKYRPKLEKNSFISQIDNWEYIVMGAFYRETNVLCGYALLKNNGRSIDFSVLKVMPDFEKAGINAAIVGKICVEFDEELRNGIYINDGSRPVLHETNFQDYLIKYFGFRKAYCRLHIKYRFPINLVIKMLYPIRRILKSKTPLLNKLYSVLMMEQYRRECEFENR